MLRVPSGPVLPFISRPPGKGFLRSDIGGGGGGGVSGHRYWRVLATASQTDTFRSIAELEFRDAEGGADLSTEAQAIAGFERTGFEKEKAFDGVVSGNNAWGWGLVDSGSDETVAWVGQDFGDGNEKDIVQVAITARADSFEEHTPTAFTVDYSDDGTNWTTAWTVTGEPNWSSSEQRTFTKP